VSSIVTACLLPRRRPAAAGCGRRGPSSSSSSAPASVSGPSARGSACVELGLVDLAELIVLVLGVLVLDGVGVRLVDGTVAGLGGVAEPGGELAESLRAEHDLDQRS
jgi:hypothetical protein